MDTPNRSPAASLAAHHSTSGEPDLVCLSHLRWDFVYQRPQHLLSRFARRRRVFFFEEPVAHADDSDAVTLEVSRREDNLFVVVPRTPRGLQGAALERKQQHLLDRLLREHAIRSFSLWYYSPMALGFSQHLRPRATVYDCMDELSAFHGAPPQMLARERELLSRSDLVFTGGQSLYEARRGRHTNVHLFASSIDAAHFGQARGALAEPADQAAISGPRMGYFGVIDERMDLELLAGVADARPDWQIVMIGPVVKIDPASLPRRANIHWLGGKQYAQLPAYIAGWDVALMPFARNQATRFISPTKTPEYLAAGKPVVSTSITDVVRPYGTRGLVAIADTVPDFLAAISGQMQRERGPWQAEVDEFLAGNSWDHTWSRMHQLVSAAERAEPWALEAPTLAAIA